ncbi:hypothetical protein TNCT_198961 [Trichonephila clavata]|uniref:Uncharacterized protein n=1 Tax=Trichonephila clavata TaxID=2740835 RepID=A0A8X6J222_TRICU|nr:hypothetical protein TNCT_198961 [Trichonephila clavata]
MKEQRKRNWYNAFRIGLPNLAGNTETPFSPAKGQIMKSLIMDEVWDTLQLCSRNTHETVGIIDLPFHPPTQYIFFRCLSQETLLLSFLAVGEF